MKYSLFIILSTLVMGQQPLGTTPTQQAPQMPPDPKLEKALLEYEKLIKEYPDNKELNYNLGNIKYLIGDLESAVEEYQKAEGIEDDISRSHSYYNMGNAMVQQGDLQNALSLYKKAMLLNPEDEDLKYNYELSKMMLQQQQKQQQNSDENKDQKEQEDQKQEQQQTQSGEQQKDDAQQKQESQQQEEKEGEEQDKQSEEESEEEKNKQDKSRPTPTPSAEDQEKKLGKEEAEAILNSLKADEKNMMKKKYISGKKMKTDKDW
ncbi:MAG: tetratricopeptide repeat protein [Fidelibacterota bacterium]